MARGALMQRLARWHIWLGWLVGLPILMWTLTGLLMVAKPIEEVRGNHLRLTVDQAPLTLPPGDPVPLDMPLGDWAQVIETRTAMQRGRATTFLTRADGSIARFDATTGAAIAPIGEDEARAITATAIRGGDEVRSAQLFAAKDVPFDFRRPMPVWQVALADGTHVYIGAQTGEIEAVRTRWWRAFDLAWGLHIMDLSDREDTSHPVLILFAFLAGVGALIGCILMFRRRRAQITVR